MNLGRTLVVVGGAAALGLCLRGLWPAAAEPVPAQAPPAPLQVDAAHYEQWVPVLRQGADVTFTERREPAAGRETLLPLDQQKTLGPLGRKELATYVRMLENVARGRFDKLHALPAVDKPGACHELVVQANLLANAEEAAAAADALQNGLYFTTEPGQLPPPPPQAGIVQWNAWNEGKAVNVSVILPWSKYPRYADAWQYKLEVESNYPAYVVGEFNAKDLAWRQAAVARYVATEEQVTKSEEYRAFRARWFPRGVRVDAGNAVVSLYGR